MKINKLNKFSLILALFTAQAEAQPQSVISGGIIRFTGTIVEGPCRVSYSRLTATINCVRSGNHSHKTQLINNINKAGLLPASLGTAKMRWLDSQRRLGIMTIQYR